MTTIAAVSICLATVLVMVAVVLFVDDMRGAARGDGTFSTIARGLRPLALVAILPVRLFRLMGKRMAARR